MSTSNRRVLISLAMLVFSSVAIGNEATGLDIGDMAPPFALEGSDGKVHALGDYRGTTVVIAWFPKAFTGG